MWHGAVLSGSADDRLVFILIRCDPNTRAEPADWGKFTLDWCAVRLHRSYFCALLNAGKTPFISPQLVLDQDPGSTVGIHYLFCLSVLCRACLLILLLLLLVVIFLWWCLWQAPAMWQFSHSQVFRDCDDGDDSDDNRRASVDGRRSSPLWFTL